MAAEGDRKRYLIDTNVFMDDPEVMFAVANGNDISVHQMVIRELDQNKSNPKIDPVARGNARKALRCLKDCLQGYDGNPVPLNEGKGTLQVVLSPPGKEYSYADPALLDYLRQEYPKNYDQKLILLTEDIGLMAQALAEKFEAEQRKDRRKGKSLHEIVSMAEEIDLPEEYRSVLRAEKIIRIEKGIIESLDELYDNHYFNLPGEKLAIKHQYEGRNHLLSVLRNSFGIRGIIPRNKEQEYLMDACLDERIRIVATLGKAGTGKTIIPLAAGIALAHDQRKYKRVMIVRPIQEIEKEIGFLPGDVSKKIDPYMDAIRDAAEVIFDKMRQKVSKAVDQSTSKKKKKKKEVAEEAAEEMELEGLEYFVSRGEIVLTPPTYFRGRSLHNSFIIVDEVQNLKPETVKTIISRTAEGSKVICTGDPYQVDAHNLDLENNGLIHLTRKFLGQDLFSAIVLKKGERSRLAEIAADLL